MDIKEFKVIVLKLLGELQGNRNEQLMTSRKQMRSSIKRKQTKKYRNFGAQEYTMTELKNTIESFNISFELGEEKISEQIY